MRKLACRGVAVLLAAGLPFAAWGATAQVPGGKSGPDPRTGKGGSSAARSYFTDTELVNQDGEAMRFYTDLLQGKVVVINTIFTTCTGICPVMSRTFTKLQDHLGERLGRDVHLISISVDPKNDTPQRLKEFGRNFGARPGWYLLTGPEESVRFVLGKLGQYVEDKESHRALILVGNEPTGLWKKAFGLAPAQDIISILDSVIRDEIESPLGPARGR